MYGFYFNLGRESSKYFRIQNAIKSFLEGIFRWDFFKTTSTHRDTSIARVFVDFGYPVTPHTPSNILFFPKNWISESMQILWKNNMSEGVWGVTGCPKSTKTRAIDLSRWVLAVKKKSHRKIPSRTQIRAKNHKIHFFWRTSSNSLENTVTRLSWTVRFLISKFSSLTLANSN